MNTDAPKLLVHSTANLAAPLNIVLTFDEAENRTSARTLLGKLLFKCAKDLDIHFDEWLIDELEHPHCRNEALDLAQRCDIFVIAAETISESFIEFVADWLNAKRKSDVGLVLIESRTRSVAAEFDCLRRLASDADVTSFSTVISNSRHPASRHSDRNLVLRSEAAPETSPINE